MDHYLDIKILPDPEFQTPMLMSALFAKLHRVLVQLKSSDIGVSFPRVDQKKPSLGDVLRLHGTQTALQSLSEKKWLHGMHDHIESIGILLVPAGCQHCSVHRVQAKSSVERLRRRYSKRHHGVTDRDAVGVIPASVEERLQLPYLQLKSESTGQSFRLFVEHSRPLTQPNAGGFNCFGLSQKATVPWF